MPTKPRSIQFTTIRDIVDAYENRGVPAFAVWHGEQLLFPYEASDIEEGKEFLEKILKTLAKSPAIYTLTVYKRLNKDGDIDSKLPHVGSFNFRLASFDEIYGEHRLSGIGAGFNSQVEELRKEITEIKKELLEPIGEGDENTTNRILGMIEPILPTLIDRILDKILPASGAAALGSGQGGQAPGKVARISGPSGYSQLSDADKISQALAVLKDAVEDLPDVLLKLAGIAQRSPAKFQIYIKMLRSLK